MFDVFSNANGYQIVAGISATIALLALIYSYRKDQPRLSVEINAVSPLREEANSHRSAYFGGRDFDIIITNPFDSRIWIDHFDGRARPWFLIGETSDSPLHPQLLIERFLGSKETMSVRVWIAGKEAPLGSFKFLLHWSNSGRSGRVIVTSYKATAKR